MIMLGLSIPEGFWSISAALTPKLLTCVSAIFASAAPSLYISFIPPQLYLSSLTTHELFCGFAFENLSLVISPLVNKCCNRRQVGEMLEPD